MNGAFNFRESTGERYKMGFTNEAPNRKKAKKRQKPGAGWGAGNSRRPFGGGGIPIAEGSPMRGGGGGGGGGGFAQQPQQQQQQQQQQPGPPTLVVPRHAGFPPSGIGGNGGDAGMLSPNNPATTSSSAVPDFASPLTWARSQFPSPEQRRFQQQHHPRHFPSPQSWKQLKPLGPIEASPVHHHQPHGGNNNEHLGVPHALYSSSSSSSSSMAGDSVSVVSMASENSRIRHPRLRPRPGQLPVDQRLAHYRTDAAEGGEGGDNLSLATVEGQQQQDRQQEGPSSSSSSSSSSSHHPRFHDLLAQRNSDGAESIGAGGFNDGDDRTVSTFGAEIQGVMVGDGGGGALGLMHAPGAHQHQHHSSSSSSGQSYASGHTAFRSADPVIEAWCDGFEREGQSFDSFMLFAEVKFNEVLAQQANDHPALTEDETVFNAQPDPSRAALCCDLLLKIADLFGRYGGLVRMLTEELLGCVYVNWKHLKTAHAKALYEAHHHHSHTHTGHETESLLKPHRDEKARRARSHAAHHPHGGNNDGDGGDEPGDGSSSSPDRDAPTAGGNTGGTARKRREPLPIDARALHSCTPYFELYEATASRLEDLEAELRELEDGMQGHHEHHQRLETMHERLHNKLLYSILFRIWRSWAKAMRLASRREKKKKLGRWFGLWKQGLAKQAQEEEAERQRLFAEKNAKSSAASSSPNRRKFDKPTPAVAAIQESNEDDSDATDSDDEGEEGEDLMPLEIHHHHTNYISVSPNANLSPNTRRNSQWGMAMLEKKQTVPDEGLMQEVMAQAAALEESERLQGNEHFEVTVIVKTVSAEVECQTPAEWGAGNLASLATTTTTTSEGEDAKDRAQGEGGGVKAAQPVRPSAQARKEATGGKVAKVPKLSIEEVCKLIIIFNEAMLTKFKQMNVPDEQMWDPSQFKIQDIARDCLIRKYGMKSIAIKNMKSLIASMDKERENPHKNAHGSRVRIFDQLFTISKSAGLMGNKAKQMIHLFLRLMCGVFPNAKDMDHAYKKKMFPLEPFYKATMAVYSFSTNRSPLLAKMRPPSKDGGPRERSGSRGSKCGVEIELERDFAQLETTLQDHVKLADLDEMIEVAMSKWEVEAAAREDYFRELKAVCRLQRRTRDWLVRAKIRVEQEQQWFDYFREFDEDIHGTHTGIFEYDSFKAMMAHSHKEKLNEPVIMSVFNAWYDETDNEFDSEEQITKIWIEEMAFRITNFVRTCIAKRAEERGEAPKSIYSKGSVLVRMKRMAIQASLSFWLSNHEVDALSGRAVKQLAMENEAAKAGGALNSARAFARVMVRAGLLFEAR